MKAEEMNDFCIFHKERGFIKSCSTKEEVQNWINSKKETLKSYPNDAKLSEFVLTFKGYNLGSMDSPSILRSNLDNAIKSIVWTLANNNRFLFNIVAFDLQEPDYVMLMRSEESLTDFRKRASSVFNHTPRLAIAE